MLAETKIYSDFIKRNKIVVKKDCFVHDIINSPKIVSLSQDDNGRWIAADDDSCFTKKAAIYWYLKNIEA